MGDVSETTIKLAAVPQLASDPAQVAPFRSELESAEQLVAAENRVAVFELDVQLGLE